MATSGLTKLWTKDRDAKRVAVAMLIALVFGGGLVLLGTSTWESAWEGLLWACACSAVGWFLGFLFGIPRSLSSDTARTTVPGPPADSESADQATPAKKAADKALDDKAEDYAAAANAELEKTAATKAEPARTAAAKAEPVKTSSGNGTIPGMTRGPSTAVNTNLEQISDWLTKIIVGVTLVEIGPAIERLGKAAELIAGSLGAAKPVSFAYAILVYFSTSGFLGSYLLTRLFLQRAFSNVDYGDSGNR